jgi:5'-deoxynucleotidase YfbR-like HD superfamily hydrolase
MNPNTQSLVDIGELILKFAKVNRATFHEDGERYESDTDHTVMLSVCACAIAEKLYSDSLDIGLVAQFAIVHDLVEAHAGDTDSFGIDEKTKLDKDRRERASLLLIKEKFDSIYPWIGQTIERYELLDTKEARFVKTLDKAMPKITHMFNAREFFKRRGLREDEMWRDYTTIVATAEEKYGAEFKEVTDMMRELMGIIREKTYQNFQS